MSDAASRRARFRRVEELFRAASALPSDQREAFLASQCRDETSICAQVKSMLRVDDSAVGVLDRPAFGDSVNLATISSQATADVPAVPFPDFIGRYRIIRAIGEGGMGIVYEAEQDNPRRCVALKVLRHSGHSISAGRHRLQRFLQEAQILGRLQHPGIAQILEAGTTDSGEGAQPFFVMELVHGRPLLEHARDNRLSIRQRLELMALICDAVHYAHQSGVVHRDLKPGNILVVDESSLGSATTPGSPAAQPKILDFGVARLTDADVQTVTLMTTVGELIGTVPYMSPEQAAGDPAQLDWRSDVYSLGVILYELLTGRLPQDVRHLMVHEAVRIIREDDATPAGSIDRLLRGDVETILTKSLEKDKTRRYQSAADLAADFRRYLQEQPISARPASAIYRWRKFARRNKALVSGVVIAFAAMLIGTIISVRQAIAAERARVVAVEQTAEAQRQAYRASLVAASSALRYHEAADAHRQLRAAPEHLRGWEWEHLNSRVDDSLFHMQLPFTPNSLGLRRDGGAIASCTSGGRIEVWRIPPVFAASTYSGDPDRSAPGRVATHQLSGNVQQRRVIALTFSADGAELRADAQQGSYRLAIDHEALEQDREGAVAAATMTLMSHDDEPMRARSRDGRFGAMAVRGRDGVAAALVICEIGPSPETGRELFRIEHDDPFDTLIKFSGDGRLMAVRWRPGSTEGPLTGLTIHRLPDGAVVCRRPDLQSISAIDFNQDGSLAAVGGSDGLTLIDTIEGGSAGAAPEHSPPVSALAFSPDGALIAAACTDGAVRLWRTADGAVISVMHGNRAPVTSLAFAADGRTFVTACNDRFIRWWDAAAVSDPFVLSTPGTVYGLAFSPDGTKLVAACLGGDQPLRIWNAASGELMQAGLDGYLSAVAFNADGTKLAVGRSHGESVIVNALNAEVLKSIPGQPWRTDWLAFDSDDQSFVSLGNQGHLKSLNLTTGQRGRAAKFSNNAEGHGCRAAFNRDRSVLAVASRANIDLLDATTWESLGVLRGHTGGVYALAFSPDGTRLVSGSSDQSLRIWDVKSQRSVATMNGHSDDVFAAVFSPDGARIVSAGRDQVIRVWDAARYEEITQLHGHTALVYCLAFSPDGQMLASGGGDDCVRLWDTKSYRARPPRR